MHTVSEEQRTQLVIADAHVEHPQLKKVLNINIYVLFKKNVGRHSEHLLGSFKHA